MVMIVRPQLSSGFNRGGKFVLQEIGHQRSSATLASGTDGSREHSDAGRKRSDDLLTIVVTT